MAKYNQLLRIEEELDDAARYAGAGAFPQVHGLADGRPCPRSRRPAFGRGSAYRAALDQAGRRRDRRRRISGQPTCVDRPDRSTRTSGRGSFTSRAAVLALVLGVLAVSYAYPLRAWYDQHPGAARWNRSPPS